VIPQKKKESKIEEAYDYHSSEESITENEDESFFSNEQEIVNLNDESVIGYSTPS
jgi:hypothetical protein